MWPYTTREWEFFEARRPRGELAVRTLAMPADTNPSGDIFGGWIMALMDSAGAITATRRAEGRVVTAAVSHISFLRPVKVGDVVCCYTDLAGTGATSISLHVEVWVLRQGRGDRIKVTSAEFTFVALDDEGRPRPLTPGRDGRAPAVTPSLVAAPGRSNPAASPADPPWA
jgi:acyl-CoA thioesterase YciA